MPVSRRRAILSACTALLIATAAHAAPSAAILHQEVDISAPPQRVYDALLDEKQFSKITGPPAKITVAEGGAFAVFGGVIEGRTIELVPGRRIVQAWRDKSWAPGVYSVVKFELTAKGRGTHLVLDQSGYPLDDFASLEKGWPDHYWKPLQKYFR